jgi:hypothetical protein
VGTGAGDRGAAAAVASLFAPAPHVAGHPAVPTATRLAREVLAPHAPAADDPARGVDVAHLALLADAGLLSVAVPADEGGLGGGTRVSAWRAADAQRTANATPACLRLLRRTVVALAALGDDHRPEAVHTAFHLGGRAASLREEAYALLTQVPAAERLPERTTLRGELAGLTVRAAQALVAARAGSALLADRPEQRWARGRRSTSCRPRPRRSGPPSSPP